MDDWSKSKKVDVYFKPTCTIIERTTRKNIHECDYGLDNFMANRLDFRNPGSEYMLKELEDIVKGELPLPEGKPYGFVSELNTLQRNILAVLEVPLNYYEYQYLFHPQSSNTNLN